MLPGIGPGDPSIGKLKPSDLMGAVDMFELVAMKAQVTAAMVGLGDDSD